MRRRRAARIMAVVVAFSTLMVTQSVLGNGRGISYAHSVAAKVAKWQKITPPKVTVNGSAFGGGNFGFQAIAVNPKSGAVYVGTCYQGLWKSTNQGKTWAKVNTGTNGDM